MFESLNDSITCEPLYTKIQRVYLKTSEGEEKQKDLRMTVDMNVSLSKVSKQVLHINISDDDDPYFYYSLILTQDDYQRLKNLQGLLVDFDNFPAQVIRLLEQCKQNEGDDSKFLLLLEQEMQKNEFNNTYLKIVERNNFKHLCHLILKIEIGNDNDIKKLMLKKIKSLKEQNVKGEKLIANLENELLKKTKQYDKTLNELTNIEQQWKEDRIAFKMESSREITEETEKLRKVQLDWQIKAQREKAELEERYTKIFKEKDAELSRLRVENQILLEKRTNTDVTIADQARRIDNLERDLANINSELNSARKHCGKLDIECHEKGKSINHLKTKLAVAEQESKDKTILTNKLQELLNNVNDQKTKIEEALNEKDKYLQKKQITIQNISDELIKANEIITKLQKEINIINSKLNIRTSIALEQEKVVENHVKTIQNLEEELATRNKKITTLVEAENVQNYAIQELKETLEAKEKKLKDNERVIDWLNRRISEHSKTTTPRDLGNNMMASTPYCPIRSSEQQARVPFSVMNVGMSTINPLEQLQTLPVVTEEEQPKENTPIHVENNVEEKMMPPLTGKFNKKQSPRETTGKNPTIRKSTTGKNNIGFRRVTQTETTPIPSSYFLK